MVNAKRLLQKAPTFASYLKNKQTLATADELQHAMKLLDAAAVRKLAAELKVPEVQVSRLIDMLVFAKIEGPTVKPELHKIYRLNLKRAFYIKCLRDYPEMFKGKKEALIKVREGKNYETKAPYTWNAELPGDEFGMQAIQAL